MGVRFVEIEDESRRHIAELVAAREEGSRGRFDNAPPAEASVAISHAPASEPAPPRAAEQAAAVSPAPPNLPAAASEVESRRSKRPWILLTVALASVLATSLWLRAAPEAPAAAERAPVEQPGPGGAPGVNPAQSGGSSVEEAAWETRRSTRILAPQWIEVGLAFVELEETGADRSRMRFVQSYESNGYRDVVRKVLHLERGQNGWKILRETVEP
jgi:hypothetical protein